MMVNYISMQELESAIMNFNRFSQTAQHKNDSLKNAPYMAVVMAALYYPSYEFDSKYPPRMWQRWNLKKRRYGTKIENIEKDREFKKK